MGDLIQGSFGTIPEDEPSSTGFDPDDGPIEEDPIPPSWVSSVPLDKIYATSRFQIWGLRNAKGARKMAADDLATVVLNRILEIESKAGSFFIRTTPDKEPYLMEGTTHQRLRVSEKDDTFMAYLWERYKLNSKDSFTPYVVSNIRNLILRRGWSREGRRFVAYDDARNILYVSRYQGQTWKIDKDGIETERNGFNRFFVDDDGGRAWFDHRPPIVANNRRLLPFLASLNYAQATPGGMRPEDQHRALTMWLFTTAFPDMMPSKPVLLLEGAQGSGKTSTVNLLQRIIHGRAKGIMISKSKGEDDFGIQLLRAPLALFDNVDTYVKWIPDAIAAYATGGEWSRRRLYKDDEEVVIRPQSFVAFASKNPNSLRREDVADRLVIIRLDRREGFTPLKELSTWIESRIDEFYGEWLHWLVLIIRELDKRRRDTKLQTNTHRMADFHALGTAIGTALGWTDDEIQSTMDAIQRERDAFAGESDALPDLIDRWLSKSTKNVGRAIEASDLLQELNVIAEGCNKPHVRSVNVLHQKLRSPHLHALFEILAVPERSSWIYKITHHGHG